MFGEKTENIFERCEPDDPNRCQAVHASQQCPFKAVPESKYCPRHGGNKVHEANRKADTKLYLSALYKDRIGEHASHPKVKTLREEIGILRITLDNILEKCDNPNQLLVFTPKIIEVTREIGKLVSSAQKLEVAMGHVLDKSQAHVWIQEVLSFITDEITDPDKLQKIANKMIESLETKTNV